MPDETNQFNAAHVSTADMPSIEELTRLMRVHQSEAVPRGNFAACATNLPAGAKMTRSTSMMRVRSARSVFARLETEIDE